MTLNKLHRVSDYEWLLPKNGGMLVDGLIIGSEQIVEGMEESVAVDLSKIASLPGILEKVVLLPNAQPTVGFPSGTVAVMDREEAFISPNAIGYDINCGLRMVTTNLIYQDIEKKVDVLMKEFYKTVPCGMGGISKISINKKEIRDILEQGARFVIEKREMGKEEELDYIEDNGEAIGANPDAVSEEAIKREKHQLGTLGSGNHYLELQIVDEIFDIEKARVFGLFKNQVVVTFHTGSRGLGYQVAVDYIQLFRKVAKRYSIPVTDEEYIALPAKSEEAKNYMGAVRAATNFGFANRQIISNTVNKVFNNIIKDVDTNTMYDLGHNTLKEEFHKIGATKQKVLVFRKGATRNFSGRMPEVSKPYKVSGQPVIISGSMGSATYVLSGKEESIEKTFGSTCHGSGRILSRIESVKRYDYDKIIEDLKSKNIYLRAKNKQTALEEAPEAYKDIEEVVRSISKSSISQRVARLKPIGVIKG